MQSEAGPKARDDLGPLLRKLLRGEDLSASEDLSPRAHRAPASPPSRCSPPRLLARGATVTHRQRQDSTLTLPRGVVLPDMKPRARETAVREML